MGEIEFKGELHTIPAGAALVLAVDRHLTREQAEKIKQHVQQALPGREVLVVGPGLTVSALERLPVVSMGLDMASGPDMAAVATVSQQTGDVTIVNQTGERFDPKALFDAITTWSASSAKTIAAAAVEAAVRDPNSRVSRALSENVAKGGEIKGPRTIPSGKAPSVEHGYYASGAGHRDIGEDPMEAARALVKKHGGGSGG